VHYNRHRLDCSEKTWPGIRSGAVFYVGDEHVLVAGEQERSGQHCARFVLHTVPAEAAAMSKANLPDPTTRHSPTTRVELDGAPAPASSLAALVSAHLPFVWRSLRRFGVPPADVDDAAQQVFLIAREKLASIKAGSERAFLTAVALRVAAHARRAIQRRDAAHQRFLEYQFAATAPEGMAQRIEARELLDRVLDRMPADLRSVFVLFELEELTIDEVAELLGLPRGTVATRLRRARMVFNDAASSMEDRHRGGES
jgi:RNA polymerase sigma-70 factor (ECF subfamily)